MKADKVIGAVDIGGTKIAVGLVGGDGSILWRRSEPTEGVSAPAAVEAIVGLLKAGAEATGRKILGVGIGCTGPVDPRSGTVQDVDFLPGWSGYPLVRAIGDRLDLDVALENDADAGALAEWRWGASGGTRFIYVSVGTGIGCGLVFDGALYRGVGGAHPEIGHHAINDAGPLCYCGMRGCWEIMASGTALLAWVRAQPGGEAYEDGRAIVAAARNGDPLASAAVQRQAYWLGIGLGNLITLFAPDRVVFAGGAMEAHDLLLPTAIDVASTRTGLAPFGAVTVQPTALAGDAPLLGAAEVFKHRFGGLFGKTPT